MVLLLPCDRLCLYSLPCFPCVVLPYDVMAFPGSNQFVCRLFVCCCFFMLFLCLLLLCFEGDCFLFSGDAIPGACWTGKMTCKYVIPCWTSQYTCL